MLLYSKLFFLLIARVLSDSILPNDSEEKDIHYPDERESSGESLGGPIDLNHQLQNLAFQNNEGEHIDEPPPDNGWSNRVPGTPGIDYPNLHEIPETSFTCDGKMPGGYYADPETGCQAFHICNVGGYKSSFLCPTGSIFNQRYFVCDWWYGFRCEEAESLFTTLEDRNNEDNNSESNEASTSDSIDNYEPIVFHNSKSTNDLALANGGEGSLEYHHGSPNNKQRNADKNEKIDQYSTHQDYSSESRAFQHYDAPRQSKIIQAIEKDLYNPAKGNANVHSSETDLEEEFPSTKVPSEYSSDKTEHQDEPDREPRGFSFNRKQPRRNINVESNKAGHKMEAIDYSQNSDNRHEKSITSTNPREDESQQSSFIGRIRFIPTL